MSGNVDRFTGRVVAYERYRLRYPSEVIDALRDRCGLGVEDVVADVGAGTGMLAEMFLRAGNRVIAVEPNAEMRAVCEQLTATYSGIEVVDASAERTGLVDHSVDLVGVGRAFHWFDQERALAEFRRVLKPGGWVVLVTNRRAKDASQKAMEYERILEEYGTDYSPLRSDLRSFSGLRPYGDTESFLVTLPGVQDLSLEALLGQTQSYSSTPLPSDTGYAPMQRALEEFFMSRSEGGRVRLDTVCEITGWRAPL